VFPTPETGSDGQGHDHSEQPHLIAPTNHEFRRRDAPRSQQGFRFSKGGVVIEDDARIGAILRQGCVISGASVARGEIPAYALYDGNPLRFLGWRR
jgi:virginiamycin A acetyltransferase